MASSMEATDMNARIDKIERELNTLSADISQDDAARKKLMAISGKLTTTLEAPGEAIWRIMMQPHHSATLRVALEMGLIEILISSDTPKTTADLANATGGEQLLIVRILRPLVALKIVAETDFETYCHTPISKAFSIPALMGGYKFMFDEAATSLAKMPAYLAETGYKNPTGPLGVFEYAHETELGMFPWLIQHPAQLSNFNAFMGGQRHNRPQWFDAFPVAQLVFDGFKGDEKSPLLIDIAGGRGYDLGVFKARFPDHPGQLILQELPQTIAEISNLDPKIIVQEHDFFTPEPVKGARAYYFRSVFHDWSDEKCLEILHNLAPAMTKGYSRLLLSEWILPDTGTPLYPALLDINMMALLSGMERTRKQWTELLASAGFEIVKFHIIDFETEGLVEAMLK